MHSFTTERLLIRPLAGQDKALYLSLYCDAKIMRNIGEPLTVETAEKAFASTLRAMNKSDPKVLYWAIIDKETNEAKGLQALNLSTKKTTAEIGIMLIAKWNGKLIPEEAMGALMEYGFTQLKINRIKACYSTKNLATGRFVNKLGFYSPLQQPSCKASNQLKYFDKQQWTQSLITNN